MTPDIELEGSDRKKLETALGHAFPTRADLKLMVRQELDKNLNAISNAGNIEADIFELIEDAIAKNYIDQLILAASKVRPDNETLKEFSERIQPLELPDVKPYPGLVAFGHENARYFYGRDVLIEKLLKFVNAKDFIAVVGNSGCGKSSLVRAGLVRELESDQKRAWKYCVFKPGEEPVVELRWELVDFHENLLVDAIGDKLSARQLGEKKQVLRKILRDESISAWDAIDQAGAHAALPANLNLLLVVDQFEELFVYNPNEVDPETGEQDQKSVSQRRRFIAEILGLANLPWIKVIITLRADFYGRALSEADLSQKIDEGLFNVLEMSRQELRDAVERPAIESKRRFEDGLVDQIIADIADSPGQLPLLQVALERLWEKDAETGVLTHESYEEIGGVTGALAQQADQVYESFTKDEKRATRDLCLQLVHVALPHEQRGDTRRRIPVSGFYDSATLHVIERLEDESVRLLIPGQERQSRQPVIELAHEMLIEKWPKLQEWLTDYRPFLEWREQVRLRLSTWEDAKGNVDDLLRGTLLNNAQEYVEQYGKQLTEAEHSFIEKSQKQRQEEIKRLQEALARAERAARVARARELAAFATGEIERPQDPTGSLALLLAHEAARVTIENGEAAEYVAWAALEQALKASPWRRTISFGDDKATCLAIARDEQILAVGTDKGTVHLLSVDDGQRLDLLRNRHQGWINRITFSPDEQLIATAGSDGTVSIWDRASEQEKWRRGDGSSWYLDVAFSPDGRHVAAASKDTTVTIWDIASGEELIRLQGHKGWVSAVTYDPHGTMLATASNDGTAQLWDAKTGKPIKVLEYHNNRVYDVAFSPNGQRLVTASKDYKICLWDVGKLGPVIVLEGHTGPVWQACFSPNGQWIVSSSYDQTVRVWDVETGQEKACLHGHTARVRDVVFLADGSWVASASEDGSVRLWDLVNSLPVTTLRRHDGKVRCVAFNPSGNTLVSGGEDGEAFVWDVSAGDVTHLLQGHKQAVNSVAFDPLGTRIATGGKDKTARLWDAEAGQLLLPPLLHQDEVINVSFDAAGNRLVTADESRTVYVWNIETGETIAKCNEIHEPIVHCQFMPDGERIIVCSMYRIMSWHIDSGIVTNHVDDSYASAMNLKPDGTGYVLGQLDGTCVFGNLAQESPGLEIKNHKNWVSDIDLDAAGRYMVTASTDETACLWDAQEGYTLLHLHGRQGQVWGVAITSDASLVATAGDDGTVCIWAVGIDSLMQTLMERVQREPRTFTTNEKRRYFHERSRLT